jgi:branched-chain amino acid transport system permease protein
VRAPVALVIDRGLRRAPLSRLVAGIVLFAALVAGAVAVWLAVSGGNSRDLLLNAGISATLVVGYQCFVGNTGIVSFGHMAFMGLGAYAGGVAMLPVALKGVTLPDLPGPLKDFGVGIVPAMLIGGGVAAVIALASGLVLMRLTGAAAGITTLALLVITNEVLRNATTFTRGTQTFYGVPQAAGTTAVLLTLLAAVVLSALFKFSPLGLRARAVRDDALGAETLGINVLFARLWPWVLSAFISGAAGALWAARITAFSPRSFDVPSAVPIIVMAVLGGLGSIVGGIAGAVVLTAWLEVARRLEAGHFSALHFPEVLGLAQFTIGVGLVLVLWLRPAGLFGTNEPELAEPMVTPSSKGGA